MVVRGGDPGGQPVHQIAARTAWRPVPAAKEGEEPGGRPGAMVAWVAWALGPTAVEGVDKALERWEVATQWRRDAHMLPHRQRKGKRQEVAPTTNDLELLLEERVGGVEEGEPLRHHPCTCMHIWHGALVAVREGVEEEASCERQ